MNKYYTMDHINIYHKYIPGRFVTIDGEWGGTEIKDWKSPIEGETEADSPFKLFNSGECQRDGGMPFQENETGACRSNYGGTAFAQMREKCDSVTGGHLEWVSLYQHYPHIEDMKFFSGGEYNDGYGTSHSGSYFLIF
jgi:hypothetical protein